MASPTLQLKIVTPEKVILEEPVNEVTLPTIEGVITILPGHVPLVAGLKSGELLAKIDDEFIPMAVAGGFVRVTAHEVVVLADYAEEVRDISEAEIEKAKARAAELQKQKENIQAIDFERFESELERSLTRAHIADKWRTKKYRK